MERINKLKIFLEQNPNDSFLQHALALEYIKFGNDTEARAIFETILQRDPAYVGSYYHLAQLLERNDFTEAAVEWYEKGMEMAKKLSDDHAYNELKRALENLRFDI